MAKRESVSLEKILGVEWSLIASHGTINIFKETPGNRVWIETSNEAVAKDLPIPLTMDELFDLGKAIADLQKSA